MSTLSKLFVVMILVLALVLLGVNATLFAMRADFKHKWTEEARHHYQTQMIKSAELADASTRIQLLEDRIKTMTTEAETAKTEIASRGTQLEDARKQLDLKQNEIEKLLANEGTFVRALEVQNQQLADKDKAVEEYKKRSAADNSKAANAMQDLMYQRQESERLSRTSARSRTRTRISPATASACRRRSRP
jgi:chromosome segregation ATPase